MIRQMLAGNSPELIERAFKIVAPRVASGHVSGDAIRYLYGVIKKLNVQWDEDQ